MTEVTVSRWGNSLALRLPKNIVADQCLKDGDLVSVTTVDGSIIIKKMRKIKRYSLEEALGKCEEGVQFEAFDWGTPVGREW